MKKVILVNTPNLPCPGSHYLHTIKFLNSFKHFGFEFIEINRIDQINNHPDSNDNIIYVSDQGWREAHFNRNWSGELDVLSKYTESNFIFWFWHEKYDILKNKINKFVLTGEHMRLRPDPSSTLHIGFYDFQLTIDNYIPLTFASNIHPDEIKVKTDFNNYIYDCNYVGYGYNKDWSSHIQSQVKSYIKYTPPHIPEQQRVDSFLNSLTTLGWQSRYNKLNNCITERIFEGMSYGCLVIHDSKYIEMETNGATVFANSPKEVVDLIRYYKSNIGELTEKVNQGYDYIRKCGTYYHTCKTFVDRLYHN